MNNTNRMNKGLKIIIGVFVGVVVLSVAYFLFPKSYITMSVAPSSMTLVIDSGKPRTIKTGQVMPVIAGKHTYVFSRDGFVTQTLTITTKNNENKEILLALDAKTDAATSILENDTDASHAIQERVESIREAAITSALNKNYPILKDLPIYARLYEITSCNSRLSPNDPTKIALCVTMSMDGLQSYVEKDLQSRGYNPSSFEIYYTGPSDEAGYNNEQ